MHTGTQQRYLEQIAWQIETGATNDDTAAHFGVAGSAIDRARAWAASLGIYHWGSAYTKVGLISHRAELGAILRRLDTVFKKLTSRPRRIKGMSDEDWAELIGGWSYNSIGVAAISRQILEYRTRLMEIEGLYKQVLNVQHSDTEGGLPTIRVVIVDPEGPDGSQ